MQDYFNDYSCFDSVDDFILNRGNSKFESVEFTFEQETFKQEIVSEENTKETSVVTSSAEAQSEIPTPPLELQIQSENQERKLQSQLHNCPKHLIKAISHQLEQVQLQLQAGTVLAGLANLLKDCGRGILKNGISREMLKIVFEENAENIQKFKLNKIEAITKIFSNRTQNEISDAKKMLRQIVAQKLLEINLCSAQNRIEKKSVNQKYIQLFIQQLKCGKIKERITKLDKKRILTVQPSKMNFSEFNFQNKLVY